MHASETIIEQSSSDHFRKSQKSNPSQMGIKQSHEHLGSRRDHPADLERHHLSIDDQLIGDRNQISTQSYFSMKHELKSAQGIRASRQRPGAIADGKASRSKDNENSLNDDLSLVNNSFAEVKAQPSRDLDSVNH